MEKKSLCPDCNEMIMVAEGGRFIAHRKYISWSDQESEENVHCRNIVDKKCSGSETLAPKPKDLDNSVEQNLPSKEET